MKDVSVIVTERGVYPERTACGLTGEDHTLVHETATTAEGTVDRQEDSGVDTVVLGDTQHQKAGESAENHEPIALFDDLHSEQVRVEGCSGKGGYGNGRHGQPVGETLIGVFEIVKSAWISQWHGSRNAGGIFHLVPKAFKTPNNHNK